MQNIIEEGSCLIHVRPGLLKPANASSKVGLAWSRDLRIRILRPLTGVIDGVPLGQFALGGTYDVTDSLGAFLVASHSAEETFSPRLRRTMDEDGGFPSSMLEGGVSVSGPPTKPE